MRRTVQTLLILALSFSALGGCGETNQNTGVTAERQAGKEGDTCDDKGLSCSDGFICQFEERGYSSNKVYGKCTELIACQTHSDCKSKTPDKPSCLNVVSIDGKVTKSCQAFCSETARCNEFEGEVCIRSKDIHKTECVKSCQDKNECAPSEECIEPNNSPYLFVGHNQDKICIPDVDKDKAFHGGNCGGSTHTKCATGLLCAAVDKTTGSRAYCSIGCSREMEVSPDCPTDAPSCLSLFDASDDMASEYPSKLFCVPKSFYMKYKDKPTGTPKQVGESCSETEKCDGILRCIRTKSDPTKGVCREYCYGKTSACTQNGETCTRHKNEETLPPIPYFSVHTGVTFNDIWACEPTP